MRSLFAGVVCGLAVKPDPCDTRSVNVSPGYAIECCGNDILVSCPETVDIIDLEQGETVTIDTAQSKLSPRTSTTRSLRLSEMVTSGCIA